jgi:hypothetical protein
VVTFWLISTSVNELNNDENFSLTCDEVVGMWG